LKPQIDPLPTPDERTVIKEALARFDDDDAPLASAWWRAGVEENLDDDDDGGGGGERERPVRY
jgi:hypothetical protein